MQQKLLIKKSHYGLILSGIFLTYALGSYISSILSVRYGSEKTLKGSLILGFGSAIVLFLVGLISSHSLQTYGIIFALLLFMVSFGALFSPSVTKAMEFSQGRQDKVSGIRSLITIIFSFSGSLVAEMLPEDNLLGISLFLLFLTFTSLIIFSLRNKSFYQNNV